MSENRGIDRRQIIVGAGAVGAAMVAGCLDGLTGDDTTSGDRSVGMIVHIDDEAFIEIQQDLQEKVEEGEIEEEEFQIKYQERQQELIISETEDLESWAESEGFEVELAVHETGALVVSDDPGSIIDALEDDRVGGMIPADEIQPPDTGSP